MALKDNMNIKQNPITGILAIVLIVCAVALYAVPYFYAPKSEVNVYVPAGIGLAGIVMWLAPDELVKIIKKKTGTDDGEEAKG